MMLKRVYVAMLLFLTIQPLFGQRDSKFQDTIVSYFNEIKVATSKHQQLWSKDLYAPILLVNPATREIFANFPDTLGVLVPMGKVYAGTLPKEINIANTAVNWNGRRWAMLMLPLPADRVDRTNLLAHELFHVGQPSLGFELFNAENNHLDKRDGRIYLRLELEALIKAVQAANRADRKMHLTNAMIFRKYRFLLYPDAGHAENLLELNEGLAEFTGSVISGRKKRQATDYFVQNIGSFFTNPTFVRSFAYQTVPIYGFMLDQHKKGWNREIAIKTNLTDYFIRELKVSLPNDLRKAAALILDQYRGEAIVAEEKDREEKINQIIAEYTNKLIVQAHLELVFEQMNVSFDPRNILPIADKGTVYPNIRITDKWGILTVKNGALMSPNWDRISVTMPLKNEDKLVLGEGWTLELKDGYGVTKDESTGNYKLIKK